MNDFTSLKSRYRIVNDWFWPSDENMKWTYPRGLPVRKSSSKESVEGFKGRHFFCPVHEKIYFIGKGYELEWT